VAKLDAQATFEIKPTRSARRTVGFEIVRTTLIPGILKTLANNKQPGKSDRRQWASRVDESCEFTPLAEKKKHGYGIAWGSICFFFSPSWMHIESLLRLSASAYADKAFMCFSLFFYVFSVAIYVSNSLYRRFSYAKVVIFRGYEAISPQGCAAYLARLISSLHGGPTSQQRSPLAPCS